MTHSNRNGFTLIELLVVIAIIAIIAAILFPVFSQAKDSAKQTQCIMQMKQIGLAHMMYKNDHDDTWSPVANATSVGTGYRPQQMWIGYDTRNAGNIGGFYGDMTRPAVNPISPGKLDPYIKSHPMTQCPKRPADWQLAVAYNFWYKYSEDDPSCSGYSQYWNRNPNATNNEYGPGAKNVRCSRGFVEADGVSDSEIEEPAETLAMWEHGAWVPVCNFIFGYDWFETPPQSQRIREHFHFLHRDSAIVGWADGHTKRLVYDSLKRPYFSVRKDIYQ